MIEHTVPPLTLGDACPSGRPYPHTYDARCVARNDPDPVMPGGESTSAQLRQTQSALAASQADLTRVERERDALARRLAVRFEALQELVRQRNLANADLEQLRAAACPDPAAHTTTDRSTDV